MVTNATIPLVISLIAFAIMYWSIYAIKMAVTQDLPYDEDEARKNKNS